VRSGELVAERFEVAAEAGSGGMSIVYRARDKHTGSLVALKVLQGSDQLGARFLRESRVLAELSHPGIVRYVAHGATASGQRYLAMEWLDGEDLAERLIHGGLTARESVTLVTRVAEALGFAHARGVVHRDVKPSNLFLPERQVERVKILDFGIARQQQPTESFDMTMTGTRLGTPAYMSPEQARGLGELDARCDVFALGCVLFECLSGCKAFSGEDAMALTAKILLEEPPKLRELGCDVPVELERLVAEMLTKDPAGRPADGSEVARRLAALQPLDDQRPSTAASAGALGGGERRLLAVVMARGAHGELDDIRRIVDAHGGHFERIADGSMVATLSGSGAATDLAAQAARCALAMRAALYGGLVAMATGRGLMAARLPLGEVIERAVKLVRAGMRADATLVSEKADTGERSGASPPTNAVAVRLDETSAGLLDARFDVGGDSEGLALRAERTMVEAARTLLGKPTPCVGREAELGTLAALFAACVDEPQARAVLVTAPAGVGKSRLRYEFMRQLRARPDALEIWMGRCDPMSAGAPFGLLGDAIRRAMGLFEGEPLGVQQKKLRARIARHVPEIDLSRIAAFIGELVGTPFPDDDDLQLRAARRDPTLMGDQMRRAWEDWLAFECGAQPVVLVLEDLHWGDLPTVRYIDAALRNLRDQPLFVLAMARPDVHEQFPRLWAERDLSEIRLGELGRKAAERLARGVLGADVDAAELARIVERAAGNAFYLEELIRASAEGKGAELPETVLAMVQARLERMEPAARHVLRAASLFGQAFWRGGLLALLGDSTEATQLDGWLQHLSEREVISQRPDRRFPDEKEYGFRHGLVREAAYGMLTESDRTLGHRLAGEWLVRAGEREAAVLAEHFERGNLPEEAIAWYRKAAEQALGGDDFAAVLTATYRAVALGAGGDTLGVLSVLSAEAHRWRGEFPDAAECAHDGLRRLPAASPMWFAAVEEAAIASGAQGQHERLVALFNTLDQLPARTTSGAELRACARLATQLMYAGRPDLTDKLLERAAGENERFAVEDPAVAGRIYSSRALRANFDGDVGGFLELQRKAAECAERAGDLRSACHDRGLIGYAALEAGALEEAARTMKEVMQRAARMGLGYVAAQQKQNLGLALARLGQLDEARVVEAEAVDAFRAFGNRRMESASKYYLGHILLLAGESVRAEEQTRDALDLANIDPPLPTIRAEGLAVLAQVLLTQGRAKEAHEAAAEAHATLERLGGIDGGEFLIRVEHAQALEAIGDHAGAVAALRAARDRLLACANKIVDASLRESFLQRVPENARIMELARAWL
jgi:eukaryotic-like serine/threonine-protein kinase